MKTIFVKPKTGAKIRFPETKQLLEAEGQDVPDNNFWRRRVLEGDVVMVEKHEKATDNVKETKHKGGGK